MHSGAPRHHDTPRSSYDALLQPSRGIRSLVGSRRSAVETAIIGTIAGICLIVATILAIFKPSFLVSPAKKSGTVSELPSNLCSVAGEERLATLVRDAVLNSSKRDRSSEASYRWCTATSPITKGAPRDYLELIAIRLTVPTEDSAEQVAKEHLETRCNELPRVPGGPGAVAVPIPDLSELGEQRCATASYNPTTGVVEVRLALRDGTDVLHMNYSRRASDGEHPLRDAVELAKHVLSNL